MWNYKKQKTIFVLYFRLTRSVSRNRYARGEERHSPPHIFFLFLPCCACLSLEERQERKGPQNPQRFVSIINQLLRRARCVPLSVSAILSRTDSRRPPFLPSSFFFLNSKCLQLVPYNLEIIRSFLSSSCLFFLNKCCPWNNIVQVKRKILIVLLFVLGFFFWFHFLSLKTTLSGAAFYNETGENQFDDHYSESCPSWNEKMYQSNVKPFSPLGTQREKNNRTLNIIKNYLTPPPPLLCKKREETRRGMLKGRVRKFYKRKDSQNCLPTCKGKKRIKKGDVAHQPD